MDERELGVKLFVAEFVNTALVVLLTTDTEALLTEGLSHKVYTGYVLPWLSLLGKKVHAGFVRYSRKRVIFAQTGVLFCRT